MFSGLKFIPRDQVNKYDDLDYDLKERQISNTRKKKSKGKGKSSRYSSSDDEGLEKIKDVDEKKIKGERAKIAVNSVSENEIARKDMGLDWMLRTENKRPVEEMEKLPEEALVEEKNIANPKELNPYLRDNGSGYPEESDRVKVGADQLLSSSLVGDGGASWRRKAFKRAQEQAAREGQKMDEVVEERRGSLGGLTASFASHSAAPSGAHLHAIKSRKRGLTEEDSPDSDNHGKKDYKREYLKDVSDRHREMRAPKIQDSLSWRKQKVRAVAAEDAAIVSAAASSLNRFSNDGSFMNEFLGKKKNGSDDYVQKNFESEKSSLDADKPAEMSANSEEPDHHAPRVGEEMSANQLEAKAWQLRLKGKHEEAEKLLQEAKSMSTKQGNQDQTTRPRTEGSSSRYVKQGMSFQQKKEDDADMHLARKIMQNKQFKIFSQADDEYDFEDGESRKTRKKRDGNDHNISQKNTNAKRFLTQQERCLFCLENPKCPMHLVVSIANYTYMMLPQWQPLVPGHCCILPIQHESATRTVDDNVWTEIRNFKKCLIMMFAKQEKKVVFLETVMGLAQQRRHCMIECIPLPQDIANEAPLYFKEAIDEAEDEWSQHNAKKLIDTSQKGLRNSIPKHFPYFHVEFGLNKGFVHVIDDEKQFKSSLGFNVIRGMLHLAEEDMYRRRRYEAVEVQKQAVASFCREWEPFDWTKQLHQTG